MPWHTIKPIKKTWFDLYVRDVLPLQPTREAMCLVRWSDVKLEVKYTQLWLAKRAKQTSRRWQSHNGHLKVAHNSTYIETVFTEAKGVRSVPEHDEDHKAGTWRGRPKIPEGLGKGRVQEKQECHKPGRNPYDDHTSKQSSWGATEIPCFIREVQLAGGGDQGHGNDSMTELNLRLKFSPWEVAFLRCFTGRLEDAEIISARQGLGTLNMPWTLETFCLDILLPCFVLNPTLVWESLC